MFFWRDLSDTQISVRAFVKNFHLHPFVARGGHIEFRFGLQLVQVREFNPIGFEIQIQTQTEPNQI